MKKKKLYIKVAFLFCWYLLKFRNKEKALAELRKWVDQLYKRIKEQYDVAKRELEESGEALKEARTEKMILEAEGVQLEKERDKIRLEIEVLKAAAALLEFQRKEEEEFEK